MTSPGFLLSFYPSEKSGTEALKRLRGWRFRRLTLIHRSQEGSFRFNDISPHQIALFGFFLALFLSLATGVGAFLSGVRGLNLVFLVSLSFPLSSILVTLAAPLLSKIPRFSVDRTILKKHAQCLVRGETVLVIQASPARMGLAIKLLRRVGKDQPTIFAFHPHRTSVLEEDRHPPSEILSPLKIRDHARSLAKNHSPRPNIGKNTPLLDHLESCESILEEVRQVLAEASHLEQTITTSAEWIMDNAFTINSHITDVRKNLPKRFYRELPVMAGGALPGHPRIYGIARELVLHTEGQIDWHCISDFLGAYQSVSHLSSGELWALPLMLRISLIDNLCHLSEKVDRQLREREVADFWANRLIVSARNEPDLLFSIISEFIAEVPSPSVNLAFQLIEHLYDEETALGPIQGWLERNLGGDIDSAILEERALQSADEASIGNAISSLRWLKQMDWREIFEEQSHLERVLRKDPLRVYTRMDFTTRDSYRHAVESLAKSGGGSEEEIARTAVSLAKKNLDSDPFDRRRAHVGHYLIDRGRRELTESLGISDDRRHRTLSWVYSHHTPVYFGAVGLGTLIIVLMVTLIGQSIGISFGSLFLLAVLTLLPASQVAVHNANYLITHLLPPRKMPKMDFERRGIPGEYSTLVVVPTLLTKGKDIRADIENLEIRYQANPDPNLTFALFTDFTDADQLEKGGDGALLNIAIRGIERLNDRYGIDRFYLLHREREWCESESCYMGWERKRGKLEDLHRFLNDLPPRSGQQIVRVGDPERLRRIRFVITLDSDTQLPRGSARRMIETMAHPLNEPVIDPETGLVKEGFTIIQPRISTSLPSAMATHFTRLFTDPIGTDPYTTAISDVYQDLTGEGSYIGKGIYDPRTFNSVLTGRFPERSLLSHDLIEGSFVRAGLASDIELLDEFPPDYISYSIRQHRWIRGDWQIADWLLPRVIDGTGRRLPNPLSMFNRWKILDNLRRSLIPPASALLLLFAWFKPLPLAAAASVLVGINILSAPLTDLVTWFLSPIRLRTSIPSQLLRNLKRSLMEASLMIQKAYLNADAITRVWFRRFISHRNMLQWTTAHAAQASTDKRLRNLISVMGLVSALSVLISVTVFYTNRSSLFAALPFLLLWFVSPALVWWIGRRKIPKVVDISPEDNAFLRSVARRTWRSFDDLVGSRTNWLPADNYQVSHTFEIAQRTSPTNIGLYLLSLLGAGDFGYLTPADMIDRINVTLGTMERMQRYEGHLLNWYDTDTLKPLRPMYVSTVDSGNLLGSQWTLVQGIREFLDTPLLGPEPLSGIADTASVLEEEMRKAGLKEGPLNSVKELISLASHGDGRDPANTIDHIHRAASLSQVILEDLSGLFPGSNPTGGGEGPEESSLSVREVLYWAKQVQRLSSVWADVSARYLGWMEEILQLSENEKGELFSGLNINGDGLLAEAPSLRQIANENHPLITAIMKQSVEEDISGEGSMTLKGIRESLTSAIWWSYDLIEEANTAISRCLELADAVNMRFLYNNRKRLFHIGFNVTDQRLDNSFYDLLASEARLASFISIARGEIPVHHWQALGRPHGSVGRRRVLLSWGGTMFEYLMPHLLIKTFENSMLHMACREAVSLQMDYGRQMGVPWGISESAYADLDSFRVYQYKGFGVPGLGLQRGLEEDLVIAPYASLLALPIYPEETLHNLHWLDRMGLLDSHGYFEAIDFTRQRLREGDAGVIVRTYMAHHQAMGFLALDNFLNGNPMQRRFHADIRVRSTEPLLFERIPALPPVYRVPTEERAPSSATPVEIAPSESKFDTPHTTRPKTQLLSNGRYSLMITNSGGGYSRWQDLDVTRWQADPTRDHWGVFCYIKDMESERIWSNTYQPVGGRMDNYVVSFALDRAEIRRSDGGVETETEILVSPEDDTEIRRITLINRSGRKRTLQVTSYVEPVLSSHRADLTHPAFNKLFISTEAIEGGSALLATRRPRSLDEPAVWVGHQLTMGDLIDETVQFETDRSRFLGRGRTPADPAALYEDLSGTAGSVLDPVLSLRRTIEISPGQRFSFAMILCAAETRERTLDILEKYRSFENIWRERDLAWRQAQLELRHLRIQPEEARRFQHLGGYMVYPHEKLRPPEKRLKQNTRGQSGLWPHSISGDLPILAVTIGDPHDIGTVTQALQAHTYWRQHGLISDLVILNEQSTSYDQPLYNQLDRLIKNYSSYTGVDTPGGIYLRTVDQISEEDLTLILSTAQVVLVAHRGPLAQQMGVPMLKSELPKRMNFETTNNRFLPSALPPLDLLWDNGTGGFSEDGSEYVITLERGMNTPAPWVNVLSNKQFGTLVSETGSGFTWYGNSQRNRLTTWSNDPVSDPASEAIYIRDEESGKYWTPTPFPVRDAAPYRIRHGAGYTVFQHNSHGLRQNLSVSVPVSDTTQDPIKIQRLHLYNETETRRHLSVTYYVEWVLGEDRETTQKHIVTSWDDKSRAMLARNSYNEDFPGHVSFACILPTPDSYTGERREFLGRNSDPGRPAAMGREGLSGRTGAGLDPCSAIQIMIKLEPGQTAEVTCLLGQAKTQDEARELVRRYSHPETADDSLAVTRDWWSGLLGRMVVDTPDLAVNTLVNHWLPYQALSCRVWGRSGFYQSGGAFGFRDQLQDVLSLLHIEPSLARDHILLAASRQFREGDVQHWWHPPTGAGIRSRCSDDLLWLPFAAAQYVHFTGDVEILDQYIPYLEGDGLEDEDELFMIPRKSLEQTSLYEHCVRSIRRGLTQGPHGLPLIGIGDWNDGLSRVGIEGSGESVWLAWFLRTVLEGMADLAEASGRDDEAMEFREKATELVAQVEKHAWDGEWYRRAYFDDGTPLGSASQDEAKIDSIAQSWAVISRGADPERARQAIESAWDNLVREDDGMVLLLTPPFDKIDADPGYIKGYPPGIRENGGQYSHAAMWLAKALAMSGDGDRAARLLTIMNPINHTQDRQSLEKYRTEPYVLAADVYLLENQVGRGGWTWYTGAAAWMYRVWLEDILGLKIDSNVLKIDPTIPADWDGFRIRIRRGKTVYDIRAENPHRVGRGVQWVEMDGRRIPDGAIELAGHDSQRAIRHNVMVRMGPVD